MVGKLAAVKVGMKAVHLAETTVSCLVEQMAVRWVSPWAVKKVERMAVRMVAQMAVRWAEWTVVCLAALMVAWRAAHWEQQ